MYKVSTYFIKGQLPGVTKNDLLERYKTEFQYQSADNISTNGNTINFSNNTFKFAVTRFSKKLSMFSKGEIEIVEEESEFIIYFSVQWTRLFIPAGLLAAALTLLSFFDSEFSLLPFVIGILSFIIAIVIVFISTNISFPFYFTALRNSIEREFRDKRE